MMDKEQQVFWLGLSLIAVNFFFGSQHQFRSLWSVIVTKPSNKNSNSGPGSQNGYPYWNNNNIPGSPGGVKPPVNTPNNGNVIPA